METFVEHTNKSIDLVQNSTPLKKLENDYDDIRDQLLEIQEDKTTPKYHRLFKRLVNIYNKIDIIVRS